jgi:DNA-binding NarL/FixJ family response regulator
VMRRHPPRVMAPPHRGVLQLRIVSDAVTVLIVDDEARSRSATRAVVTETDGFEALAEAASGEEALEAAVALRPRLVLVDASLPGLDGEETSRRVRAALPDAVVLLLSAKERDELSSARPRAIWASTPGRAQNA